MTEASRWEDAGVVRGFSTGAANEILLDYVRGELARRPGLSVLDVVAHDVWNLARSAAELLSAGFEKDPPGPLTEYNRPDAGLTRACGGPVILEGTFRTVRHP
ncbi:MAG: hypothetical protein ACYDBY_04790 [Thermoanaerobaculia bacterium]